MNPILQMLNQKNQMNSVMGLVNALKNGNTDYMYNQMINSNPQFKKFVDDNKDKSVEEVAQAYGIDMSVIKQLLR